MRKTEKHARAELPWGRKEVLRQTPWRSLQESNLRARWDHVGGDYPPV